MSEDSPQPRLTRVGKSIHLTLNGEPMLLRGGEVGNSSASSISDIQRVLASAVDMGLNVVLVPICWDQIEPEEDRFEFSILRTLLEEARAKGLNLIILWFGTWKNSMSCYVPGWVKRDSNRFKRVLTSDGAPQEMLSPSCENSVQADARAYRRLLEEIETLDGENRTILMIQVENEVGMIPEPMDRSAISLAEFELAIPEDLIRLLEDRLLPELVACAWESNGRLSKGSWQSVLGESPEAQECFTAWQLASYCEAVAREGKKVSGLPTFANAALIRPGFSPGRYPSGGPLPHLRAIWETFAPSIDFIAPDIYFPNFSEWASAYACDDRVLFIPEAAPSARIAANTVFAIGELNAIGVCPFAFEDMSEDKRSALRSLNECLAAATDLILAAQRQGRIAGLVPPVDFDWNLEATVVERAFGDVGFLLKVATLTHVAEVDVSTLPTHGNGRWEAPSGLPLGGCLLLELGELEWLMIGCDCQVQFFDPQDGGRLGLERAEEGYFSNGEWVLHRTLNGDQTHQGRQVQFHGLRWTMQRVKLYRY